MTIRKKRPPKQIRYLKTVSQVKNGDMLDVAEAAALCALTTPAHHEGYAAYPACEASVSWRHDALRVMA